MKRQIIALSVALIMVLAGPVAAAGIDFSGVLETNIEVNKLEEEITVTPSSSLELNLGLSGGEGNIRAGVEFELEKEEDNSIMPVGLTGEHLVLSSIFVETDGAFWHGGPEATTRFGSLELDYGPYALVKGRSGVSVGGMDLGALSINGFYGLAKGANEAEEIPAEEFGTSGFRADVNIDDIHVGGSVIHGYDTAAEDERIDVALDANAKIDKLEVNAAMAGERVLEVDSYLWTARADYEAMDNLNVHAGYRSITENWVPKYAEYDDEDEEYVIDWLNMEDRARDKGLFLGLNTEQQGINMDASYDQMFEQTVLGASTEVEGFELAVTTTLNTPSLDEISTDNTKFEVAKGYSVMEGLDVEAGYEGKWVPGTGITHTVKADAAVNLIPAVRGLELNSEVSFTTEAIEGYEVGASFTAPNGLDLGVSHVKDEGTTMTAGMTVNF